MVGAVNQPLDAHVFDIGPGTGHLIDYTFVNSMKSTGKNGAARGGHADNLNAEGDTYSTIVASTATGPSRRLRFWPCQ